MAVFVLQSEGAVVTIDGTNSCSVLDRIVMLRRWLHGTIRENRISRCIVSEQESFAYRLIAIRRLST